MFDFEDNDMYVPFIVLLCIIIILHDMIYNYRKRIKYLEGLVLRSKPIMRHSRKVIY